MNAKSTFTHRYTSLTSLILNVLIDCVLQSLLCFFYSGWEGLVTTALWLAGGFRNCSADRRLWLERKQISASSHYTVRNVIFSTSVAFYFKPPLIMLLDIQQCHFPPSLKQACYCTFKTCICKWTVMIGEHQHTGVFYWGGSLSRCWYVNVGGDMLMSLWLWCHNHVANKWRSECYEHPHWTLLFQKSEEKTFLWCFECTQNQAEGQWWCLQDDDVTIWDFAFSKQKHLLSFHRTPVLNRSLRRDRVFFILPKAQTALLSN